MTPTFYVNGNKVSKLKAEQAFQNNNRWMDWPDLASTFRSACDPRGEQQRDILLDAGIEITFED
jgi:hypothetical protein